MKLGGRTRNRTTRSTPAVPSWATDTIAGTMVSPARVRWPSRILLWCAGVERTVLRTGVEVMRYSGLGALVVAVAAIGATTFTIFASVVIGHFRWYLALAGVMWGTIILLIDRAIVTEPHYWEREASASLRPPVESRPAPAPQAQGPGTANGSGSTAPNGPVPGDTVPNGTLPNGTLPNGAVTNGAGHSWIRDRRHSAAELKLPSDRAGWHLRGLVYTMRLLISLCIAFLVAEAAMLLIFHPEVWDTLESQHAAQYQHEMAVETNAAISQDQKQISTLYATWQQAELRVTKMQTQVDDANSHAADEGLGTSSSFGNTTGNPGYGPQWQQDTALTEMYETQLASLTKDASKDETAYQKAANALSANEQGAQAGDQAALGRLGVPDPASQRADIYADNGLDAQEHAFDAFVASNRGDLLVTATPWVIRVLLVAIDLVPLGTKLLNRYTIYGRRLSERALLIRYRDMVQDNITLHDIDQLAAIRAMHREHDYEVETERVGWHRWWRMNHMSSPE